MVKCHYRVINLVQFHGQREIFEKWRQRWRERQRENNLNTTSGFSCLFIQWSFAPELTSLSYSLLREADPLLLHPISFSKKASCQVCRRRTGKGKGGQGIYPHFLLLCLSVVVVAFLVVVASLQFTASVRHHSSSNWSLGIDTLLRSLCP